MTRTIVLIGVMLGVITCSSNRIAFAFDDDITHRTLTEIAVARTRLAQDPSLLAGLGLQPYGQNLFGASTPGIVPQMSIFDLIVEGAVAEDATAAGIPRSLYHFYDPQNNRGLTTSAGSWNASPDWILQDDDSVTSLPPQFYSYDDARSYYRKALTEGFPAARESAFANMFKSLGHVVHHVQDMGQPQHVRNEAHCNAEFCKLAETVSGVNFYSPSAFEYYTAFDKQQQKILNGTFPTTNYPIQSVILDIPRDYWIDSSSAGVGMADFVSTNFITVNDGIEYNPALNAFRASSSLPLPDGVSWSLSNEPCVAAGQFGSLSGNCDFVRATVVDPLVSTTQTHIVGVSRGAFHAISSLQIQSGQGNQYLAGLVTTDATMFDSRYHILFPRIVSFSAGMIDYFFRGDIDLSYRSSDGTWRIKNNGQEPISGDFTLYSDASDGFRSQVLDGSWNGSGYTFTIQPGSESGPVVVPDESSVTGLGDMTLVFRGEMGDEGAQQNSSIEAVAGKQVNMPRVTIEFGDSGPILDDAFYLHIDGQIVAGTSSSNPVRTLSFMLAPGTHTIALSTANPGAGDTGASGFIRFTSQNVNLCCNQYSATWSGQANTTPFATWNFVVSQ